MSFDREAAERAVHDLLTALGHPPSGNAELDRTAERVVAALHEDLLSGHGVDALSLIEHGSSERPPRDERDVVWVRGLTTACVCPHHLTPAWGSADVAYAPGARLLGLGTIAELVDAYARRLTFQEAIGDSVTAALMQFARAEGAFCRLRLRHGCLCARGARQAHAEVETISARGTLAYLADGQNAPERR
ncbi:MAG TPA: GTP cyclohydrolase I [Polyangiaceae bacterium]|jgi:GTP cyclohydrolase I